MTILKTTIAAAGLALAAVATPSFAVGTTDASNDFLATFTGSKTSDLDILSASVTFNGTAFLFTATMAGNTNQAANPLYVLGFNRGGATTPNFAAANIDGVAFDAVVRWGANGVATTNLAAPNAVGTVSGMGTTTMTLSIDASLLPSTGFALQNYTWNFWTRDNNATIAALPLGNQSQLADFAPNNAMLNVPEPASLALLGLAFAGLAGSRRRRA